MIAPTEIMSTPVAAAAATVSILMLPKPQNSLAVCAIFTHSVISSGHVVKHDNINIAAKSLDKLFLVSYLDLNLSHMAYLLFRAVTAPVMPPYASM